MPSILFRFKATRADELVAVVGLAIPESDDVHHPVAVERIIIAVASVKVGVQGPVR